MYTDKHLIDTINSSLHQQFRVLDGRPIYRLVWSDDQYEVRKGKFSDYYGKIFIREVTAVRRIKKYWYMEEPCWVLEKLTFIASRAALKEICEELVESGNGSYETIYAFQDRPVALEVVEFILHALHNPKKIDKNAVEAMEKYEDEQEVKYFEDQLGEDERSPLFVWENSAFVSTNQLKFKQDYVEKTGLITTD